MVFALTAEYRFASIAAAAVLRRRRFACVRLLLARLLLLLWCCTHALTAAAANGEDSERQIKAAFLYKFCLYVEWPAQAFSPADSPLELGVAGSEPLVADLRKIVEGRSINGRTLAVRRVDKDGDLSGLHLLFVGQSEQGRLSHWLQLTRGLPLLIITEAPPGLDAGGTIAFAMQENRIRFDIDLASATQQGLHLSAQLLKAARTVREDLPP